MVARPTRNNFFSDLSAQIGQAIINFLILKAIMGIAGTFTGTSSR